VNEQHNTEQDVEQGVSRRSFIQLASVSGLALTAGCIGESTGGTSWIPSQYEGTGNFPVQVRGRIPIDPNNLTIERDDQKCVICGQCAEVCDRYQAVMGHYELPLIDDIPCIGCGQCTLWCPTSSITERDDTKRLFAALDDPDKHVVVQFAPSTRVGLGEEFGLPVGTNVEGKQISALRALGFDTILDTNFAADLTIMEEATEFVQRLTTDGSIIPLFTSCCPGWVKFCEMFYPELIPNLSTARSPMGMLGPVIKTYYAKENNIAPEKIVSVSVMPCTAKKYECARPEMNNAGEKLGKPELRDTDIVITTRELARMIKQKKIDFLSLEEGVCDKALSAYTGGGAIFGASGGVMEAAVRTAYHLVTKENPPAAALDLKSVRGLDGIKRDGKIDVPGFGEVRVAVVSGTANAKEILAEVKEAQAKGEVRWHFIEFMACPGGCISGGGQPKSALPPSDAVRNPRAKTIYEIDKEPRIRSSHENPEIKALYENYLEGGPCGEIAHHLLHSHTEDYVDRSIHFTAKK
jgi:iron-only hydrogenase group A